MQDKLNAAEAVAAGVVARPSLEDALNIKGRYVVECIGADGAVKWTDEINNLVTTEGKNDFLTQYLKGATYSAGTVYMGLKGTGSAAAGDTLASHAGWSELNISASSGARIAVTLGTASGGSLATSSASSFSITAAGPTTVAGVFVVTNGGAATNGSTTGKLFSAGDFSSSRSVISGDTLNVSYTASV